MHLHACDMCVCVCVCVCVCACLQVCNCNYTIPPQFLIVCFNLFFKAGTVEQAEKREGGASDGDPTDAEEKRETTQIVEQEQPPPCKKTALEYLLGATFDKSTVTQSKCKIEVEIDMYKKDTSIPLTSCPLKWWKEHAEMYPLLSSLSKAYLTIPATSVPS